MDDPKHTRALNRLMWRSRLKMLLQLGGVILMVIGTTLLLPRGRGAVPSKITIYDRIASLGAFTEPGVILFGVGVIAVAASLLMPGDLYEGP